ncbi:MAG TPA: TlyA family RNA methyltransferase [Candidatus Saccharimonadales bacterium]|nr:TlyA family RNA methyltransferase [Candidatus Saccharimonadales bacterium]
MAKQRLDQALVQQGLVSTRSQAESYIKLGDVKVDGRVVTKPGAMVDGTTKLVLAAREQYVSRAALKLASVSEALNLNFQDKIVLDVGSSTGGFTDYALRHGATKVIAVELGTNQLHPSLRRHKQIELYEKTDIRDFRTDQKVDVVVADVSFISLREILPSIIKLVDRNTNIAVMVKPQFEAVTSSVKHKGVIKNDKIRRQILKDFEVWATQFFRIIGKADSEVTGSKGNRERFYLLRLIL